MEPGHWWGHGFGFMWLMPVFFLLILFFCMRGMFGRGTPSSDNQGHSLTHQENARDILDKRFAKGEVSKEEYEEIKNTLKR